MVNKSMIEKKQKNITPKRLKNIALYYLERYDSSSANLKRVLKIRVLKAKMKGAEVPNNIEEVIDEIIEKVKAAGYINDERYMENTIRRMKAAGKSKKQTAFKLASKGINSDMTEEAFLDYDDAETAIIFVNKHKLGQNPDNYEKDLAKLGRAGFSFDTAKAALAKVKEQTELNKK